MFKVYYHISMMNNWEEAVKEQISLLVSSGLYDECESVSVGCNGLGIERLHELIAPYRKIKIRVYEQSLNTFEFPTLKLIEQDYHDEFYGLYFHTKGVTFPNHSGGKYWRDYMNHFNIVKWRDAVGKLNDGYDTCGVKYLSDKHFPAYIKHYSGNFFWFKSSYIRNNPKIDSLDLKDRFQAEFWACRSNPKAASLCQMFVNYNTKGVFSEDDCSKSNVYVHTLAYNLPSEVDKAVRSLYDLNPSRKFFHYVVDLDYPLYEDTIPNDVKQSKLIASKKMRTIAKVNGSSYLKYDNVGVSQNWQSFVDYVMPNDNDIVIGADPDERPLNMGWVDAIKSVMDGDDKIAVASLFMTDHQKLIHRYPKTERIINGIRVWEMDKLINWALIGIKGSFLNKIDKIPFPEKAPKYGWLEHELYPLIIKHGYKWVILPDYLVKHTDYPQDVGTSKLYRAWKNQIIHKIDEFGQISFEDYLVKLRNQECFI